MSQNGFTLHIGDAVGPLLMTKKDPEFYRNADPVEKQPVLISKVFAHILDLSNKEHLDLYSKIWNSVGIGISKVVSEEKQWMPKTDNWKVLILWYLDTQMDPSELRTERQAMANALYKSVGTFGEDK